MESMITEKHPSGAPFCHIVIPAPDLGKAKSFFETIFGWRVHENVPGPSYWFFESGNVGGAFDASKPVAPSVLLIMRVVDMETTLNLIMKGGGRVTRGRRRIGRADPGYDAYFIDPNGNEMGLYSDR